MKFEIENQWLLIAKKNRKVAASFWLLEQASKLGTLLFALAQGAGASMDGGAVVKWRRRGGAQYPGCCTGFTPPPPRRPPPLLQIVYGLTNAISIMYVIHSCSQAAVL